MIDVSNRVHLVNPRLLLVETTEPFPLRFGHVVMITRVVTHHGGGVEMLAEGHRYDASSVVELITSLRLAPPNRRLAFTGTEAALDDLDALCRHLLSRGDLASMPDRLRYLL